MCFSENNLLPEKDSTVELLSEKKAVFNPKKKADNNINRKNRKIFSIDDGSKVLESLLYLI
jgi:hypothetical protein